MVVEIRSIKISAYYHLGFGPGVLWSPGSALGRFLAPIAARAVSLASLCRMSCSSSITTWWYDMRGRELPWLLVYSIIKFTIRYVTIVTLCCVTSVTLRCVTMVTIFISAKWNHCWHYMLRGSSLPKLIKSPLEANPPMFQHVTQLTCETCLFLNY